MKFKGKHYSKIYILVALMLSLFFNCVLLFGLRYLDARWKVNYANLDKLCGNDNNPVYISGVSTERPLIGKEWVLYGRSLGSVPNNVVFSEDSLNLNAKVIRFEAEVVSWNNEEIKVIVPEELNTDQGYLVHVYGSERRGGQEYIYGFKWKRSNVFVAQADFRFYKTQHGDSLYGIAARELGAEGRYIEILDLNKKQYPSLEENIGSLGIGLNLKIPKE